MEEDTKQRIIIWDIDGTLADTAWRQHYIECQTPDWDAFINAAIDDSPIPQVYYLYNVLSLDPLNRMIIVTARDCERSEKVTLDWLAKWEIKFDDIFFRQRDDRRPDYEVKEDILYQIEVKYLKNPFMVFDDRKQVIEKCWNANEVFCFDVGQGKGDF